MLNVFTQYWWQFLVVCAGSYLVGAINFAILFSRLIKLQDIRNYGSGNAGTTNMFRVYGLPLGALTLVCDVMKGVVCIFFSKWIFADSLDGQALTQLTYVAALFSVIGHVFPVYYSFRGGKGVATAIGCVFALHPLLMLCLLAVQILIIVITDRMSVSALILSVFMLVWSWVVLLPKTDLVCAISFTLIFLFVIFAHRGNISRLLKGKERKTGILDALRGNKNQNQ